MKNRLWPWIGGIVVTLLTAAVFMVGSLDVPLRPERGSEFAVFFALTTLLTAALLVFAVILARSLVRLWIERRSGQMGSRFKVKMVLGAIGVSLLPTAFFFILQLRDCEPHSDCVVSAAAGNCERAEPATAGGHGAGQPGAFERDRGEGGGDEQGKSVAAGAGVVGGRFVDRAYARGKRTTAWRT